jgi:hypothetical protein
MQRFINLIDVRFVRDFHGDHFDAVFSGQLENVRQTLFAVTLK